jgi:hypothetical protein
MSRPTFFARTSLLILIVVFFLVPFALRGARFAMQGMKIDVKDWLPKDFQETRDLDEFRRYFLSEQFVLVSWDGCRGDDADERFKLFTAKLIPETPPSALKKANAAALPAADASTAEPQFPPLERPKPSRSTAPRAICSTTTTSSATAWASTMRAPGTKTGAGAAKSGCGACASRKRAVTKSAGTT